MEDTVVCMTYIRNGFAINIVFMNHDNNWINDLEVHREKKNHNCNR